MQVQIGSVVERYRIEAVLGQGAMAVVYRVKHTQLGTRHALKLLLVPAASLGDRLLREGRVQAGLRHPNIVSVTDVITYEGAPGLVMEYVEGPTLEDVLRGGKLPREEADAIAVGILSGVAAAHQQGLVHRDLKPANVLLEKTKRGWWPRVADFGLAKLVDDDEGTSNPHSTKTGMTMGTPLYMSPEQIRDAKSVDCRADVFSCGAMLYELIAGERAFYGNDVIQIFTQIANGRFKHIREVCPDVSPAMEAAIMGALAVDRDQRIPDGAALLAMWTGVPVGPNGTVPPPPPREAPPRAPPPRASRSSSVPAADPARSPGAVQRQPSVPEPVVAAHPPKPTRPATYKPPAAPVRAVPDPGEFSRGDGPAPRVEMAIEAGGGGSPAILSMDIDIGGDGDTPPIDEEVPQFQSRMPYVVAAVVAMMGVGLLLIVGAAAILTWMHVSSTPEAVAAPVAIAAPNDTPVTSPDPTSTETAPPVPDPTVATPTPTPVTSPEPPKPAPEPPKPAPTPPVAHVDPPKPVPPKPHVDPPKPTPVADTHPTGTSVTTIIDDGRVRVAVTGDAKKVYLMDGGDRFDVPGTFFPGTYGIQADFGDGVSAAGSVTLTTGIVNLSCSAATHVCAGK